MYRKTALCRNGVVHTRAGCLLGRCRSFQSSSLHSRLSRKHLQVERGGPQAPFFHCSPASVARNYFVFGKGSAVRSKIALAIAAAALGACTPPAAIDIDPSYVSPVFYQNHTCQQLEQEAATVSSRVAQASAVQDNALLLGGGNTAVELASLKGQLVAIEQASTQKNCGIQFPQMPAKQRSGIFHLW